MQVLRKPRLADEIPVFGPFFGDLFYFLQKGPGKKRPVKDKARADYLAKKQEEVGKAQAAAANKKVADKQAPTWRDNEEKVVQPSFTNHTHPYVNGPRRRATPTQHRTTPDVV